MYPEVICIDDSNRPKEISIDKWVKKDSKYTIIYTVQCLPQKKIGVHLAEIELTEKELPYEYFLLNRFSIDMENLELLKELIKNCTDLDFNLSELLKQTELELV